jgi:hypothetical protein
MAPHLPSWIEYLAQRNDGRHARKSASALIVGKLGSFPILGVTGRFRRDLHNARELNCTHGSVRSSEYAPNRSDTFGV